MNVQLSHAEAVKLAKTFKDLYNHATVSREFDKRIKTEYINLVRKIEDVETAMMIEEDKRTQRILDSFGE